MELTISLILQAIYFIIVANLIVKALKWLFAYFHRWNTMKNLKSLPTLPFIGNVHLIKRKHGIFNLDFKILIFLLKNLSNKSRTSKANM